MKKRTLLSKASEIKELADRLSQEKTIAFDTEFIRESTFFPQLEIIQIGTESEVYLVDAKAFANRRDEIQPLLDILTDPKILKIAHAIQGDQECLFFAFGIVATPCLDTALGAALAGYGDGIGLANLHRKVLDIEIKKGFARTNWSARPLPDALLEYAASDVVHLVKLANCLFDELDDLNRRQWALELSAEFENKELYDQKPADIAERLGKSGKIDKRAYPVLIELVNWREARVREVNLPRRWVADDGVLIDLARARPKKSGELFHFRGLNKGEIRNSGEKIIEAIRRGASDRDKNPPPRKAYPPTPFETKTINVLRCYVGILAEKKKIAPRFLLSADNFLTLVREESGSLESIVERNILTKGAAEIIGRELVDFLNGKRALSIQDGEVKIVPVE